MLTKYSCVLNAFSLATGISEADLLIHIGHDGSEMCGSEYRGFSVDELSYAILQFNWMATFLPVKLHRITKDYSPIFFDRNLAKEYFDKFSFNNFVFFTPSHAFCVKSNLVTDPGNRIKSIPDWDELVGICVLRNTALF